MTDTTEAKSLRLFFALWPDDGVRDALVKINRKLSRQHRGKLMRPENLHITLAFLGNVPASSLDCLLPMAEQIAFTPFELNLDHLGIFPRAQVIWAGQETVPEALTQLVKQLYDGVTACGVALDKRPFKAHLTLMRKVKRLNDMPVEPVHWAVNDFCLVSSLTHPEGVEYRVIHRWPCR